MRAVEVDVRGLSCSDAVVRVHHALLPLARGASVRVLTDDPTLLIDLKAFASRGGHSVGGPKGLPGGALEVEVRKGA